MGEGRIAGVNDIELRIIQRRTKLHVQSWTTASQPDSIARALGVERWPGSVGETTGDRHRVLCHGPVDWLVVSDEEPSSLLSTIEAAAAQAGVTVTDQSQGLGALEAAGPRVRELLAKACGLDFHPGAFPRGSCARTRFASLPALLEAAARGDSFTIYVARSYLDYLGRWLSDAALELRS